MPDAQQSRQQLIQQWLRLQVARPDLTRRVGFSADNTLARRADGTLPEAQTHQGYPINSKNFAKRYIEMDPVQAGKLTRSTNDYAMAHELGHANERQFITTKAKAAEYNRLRGAKPFTGQGYGVVGLDQFGLERSKFGGFTPANELYAADFAGAIGRKWPDGTQLHGRILQGLQRQGILPRSTR